MVKEKHYQTSLVGMQVQSLVGKLKIPRAEEQLSP